MVRIEHMSLVVGLGGNSSSQKPPLPTSAPPLYSCHSWFVHCCVLHVISQPILEHECMGSNVKGSVHLTHPSALHQTPSVEPPCILRQPARPKGTGGRGGVSESVGGGHSSIKRGWKWGRLVGRLALSWINSSLPLILFPPPLSPSWLGF